MEQYLPVTKVINGGTYGVTKMPAAESFDIFTSLHKWAGIIGVALNALRGSLSDIESGDEDTIRGLAISVLAEGAGGVGAMIADPDFKALQKRMFAFVTYNGRELDKLPDHWAEHLGDYHALLVHVLDVQYGQVFRAAAGTLLGLSGGQSNGTPSPTQQTSTGGSPSSSPKEVSPPSS